MIDDAVGGHRNGIDLGIESPLDYARWIGVRGYAQMANFADFLEPLKSLESLGELGHLRVAGGAVRTHQNVEVVGAKLPQACLNGLDEEVVVVSAALDLVTVTALHHVAERRFLVLFPLALKVISYVVILEDSAFLNVLLDLGQHLLSFAFGKGVKNVLEDLVAVDVPETSLAGEEDLLSFAAAGNDFGVAELALAFAILWGGVEVVQTSFDGGFDMSKVPGEIVFPPQTTSEIMKFVRPSRP